MVTIDHKGQSLKVGDKFEILPVKLFKTGLGWYRKIARMRKHSRYGTIVFIYPNGELGFKGADNAPHFIPSRYVLLQAGV